MTQRFGISQPVRRREDIRLIAGRGLYVDDMDIAGQVYAHFVRSNVSHGVLRALDVNEAAAMPGVLAVFSGKDLRDAGIDNIPYLPIPGFPMGTPVATPRSALAGERVRYVGEHIAMVVAETREQALDAAERVAVEIDQLPAVTDVERAVTKGAPVLWPDAPDNVLLSYRLGDEDALERAFNGAAHVTRIKLRNNRVLANPMEVRAVLASYDAVSNRYDLTVSSQGVTYYLRGLSEGTLRLKPDQVHIRTPDVGGAFGNKEFPYPEDVAVLFAARALGRPVKWTGTRAEHFLSDNHARDAVINGELALDQDGNFLAIRVHVIAALGAYCSYVAPITEIRNTTHGLSQAYKTPLIGTTHRVVATNCTPVGPYRGAGREQAALTVEALVDKAAREFKIDPAELRRRNLLPREAFPYVTPAGRCYDSGDFEGLLNKTLTLADWNGFSARAADAAKTGKLRGRGLSMFVEPVGGVPFEGAELRFADDGTIVGVVASQSSGQGHETSLAQVIADRLKVPFDKVRIKQGDSRDVPRGMGSFASRTMIMAGSAMALTCDKVIARGKELAAQIFGVSGADIEFSEGLFRARNSNLALDIIQLAERVRSQEDMSGLDSVAEFTVKDFHYPSGCHVCEIEIDPDTGQTAVVRYTAVDDCGVVVNPMIVHGQIHGGVAQGIGQTLMEYIVYDEAGQLVTGTFQDYALPRAADLPEPAVDFHVVPSPSNPLGVKGCGEAGVTGSIAAVSNAVRDALDRAGVHATIDMPFTPERVWRVLNQHAGP